VSGTRPDGDPTARGRVVISSVTGKPITWDETGPPRTPATAGTGAPILPDRVAEDAPEPGSDESNDDRIAGDVPPHWGRGR
jgi:hypothetical protein